MCFSPDGGSSTLVEGNYIGLANKRPVSMHWVTRSKGFLSEAAPTTRSVAPPPRGQRHFRQRRRSHCHQNSATTTLVQGNLLSTDWTGTVAVGNLHGITVETANNTIGGTTPAARNIIAASNNGGIVLSGIDLSGSNATGNVVQGNFIGTNVTGTAALGSPGTWWAWGPTAAR